MDDWGTAWIDYVLRGVALPADVAMPHLMSLDSFANGLRLALGAYSWAMLILAGFILFYHLTAIIVETAHSGVVMGGRVNAVWAPLRMVVAIGLLVPISGGLSAGQYIVIKIAEEGSATASKAWQEIKTIPNDNFFGMIMPHMPPVGALVATATEMELCRLVYEQAYAAAQNDAAVAQAGHINDAVKIPAGRLSGKIWRYSNLLNADVPLCGEYRFSATRPRALLDTLDQDETARIAANLATFSEEETDKLRIEAQGIALREIPAVLNGAMPAQQDAQNSLAAAETDLRKDILERMGSLLNLKPFANTALNDRANGGGWIGASLFIPDSMRVQQSYGEMISMALPSVQEPLFAHPSLARQALNDTSRTQAAATFDAAESDRLAGFYRRVSRTISAFHQSLYSYLLLGNDFVPASNFDLQDQISLATSPDAAWSLFGHAIDIAAIAQGVWGVNDKDDGYPFAGFSVTNVNPFALASEYGRRQSQLGLYLLGLAGQEIGTPNVTAPAAVAGIGGILLLLGGMALIFLLPFFVFLRFVFAIMAWMLALLEAVAAMPVVALAHLNPVGSGVSGGLARQAYMMWLALWARPVLTLLGFAAGLIVFMFGLSFACLALQPLAQLSSTGNSGLLITSNMASVLLFDITAYALANFAFKGISLFPDQSLKWVSRFVMSDSGEREGRTAPSILTSGSDAGHFALPAPVNAFSKFFAQGNMARAADRDTVSIHREKTKNQPDKETASPENATQRLLKTVAAKSALSAEKTSERKKTVASEGIVFAEKEAIPPIPQDKDKPLKDGGNDAFFAAKFSDRD